MTKKNLNDFKRIQRKYQNYVIILEWGRIFQASHRTQKSSRKHSQFDYMKL